MKKSTKQMISKSSFSSANSSSIYSVKRTCRCICIIALFFGLAMHNSYGQSSSCNSGKIDPRVAFLANIFPDLTMEQENAMTIEQRRKSTPPNLHPVPADKMQWIKITADSIPVVIYKPDSITQGMLPVIIDYHGGGFIAPLQPWMYNIGYGMANYYHAVVFQIDYDVAPEHRFPAAITSSYEAFKWLSVHANIFGGDTSRIMVSGASAGANIAAVMALMAKKDGIVGRIKFVSLFCPLVDNPINSRYESYKKSAKGYVVTKNDAIWAIKNYVGSEATDTNDYRLFPIRAKSFESLPPTLVFTAEFDVLRDEGEAYANKLIAAGVPTSYRCFPGELHVLAGLPDDAEEWKIMVGDTKAFMKKYW
ncbi:MAG: alpha/beta hydrolase [Ginsengibacter sp.]